MSAPSTVRLDAELVRRGLARARGHAGELVRAGRVTVGGAVATKASQPVPQDVELAVEDADRPEVVGRGALKLRGFLDDLQAAGGAPLVHGRRCLDAGASTGGFTQVLLEHGAASVVAVDVGHDQLAPAVRDDPRVEDRPGTSVRGLDAADVGGRVDLLVADLSFISTALVLPDLVALVRPGGDLLPMVKPQFEVGRRRLGSGGVVRDPALRAEAVLAVATEAHRLGLVVRAVRASRWPGPSGNVEYFMWLTLPETTGPGDGSVDRAALAQLVQSAVEEGPS